MAELPGGATAVARATSKVAASLFYKDAATTHARRQAPPTAPGTAAVGQHGLEVAALDQPHRHIQPTFNLAKVIDRHHARLVEPGCGLGLPPEPFLEYP